MADAKPRAGELTTANYGWTKPNVGNSDDAWGGMINADLDGIDSTVKSVSNVANAAYPASNPSGYQTAAQVTAALPAASSSSPLMDGTAAAGTGTTWARADHIHPTDTSRYAASNPSGYQTAAQVTAALPVASSTTPAMDGTAAVGVGTTWARADHVHPTDVHAIGDNRIINGDMRIDQRNNGASGTASSYTVDRWQYGATQANKITWQQSGGSCPGFPYALKLTVSAAFAVAAGDTFYVLQTIEADMLSDLGWGSSGVQPQPVTFSFWAFSSLTGTFAGAIQNGSSTRSCPFTFSIPSASTWTKIAVTVPADTSGTWTLSGNAAGMQIFFDLGSGANFRAAAGAWGAGNKVGATGAINLVATLNATFYVTGVKLEIGSVATPFNRQSLAKSMADCQRYYEVCNAGWVGDATSGGSYYATVPFAVEKRASPTVTSISQGGAANGGFNTRASSASALPTRTAVWGGALSAATGASKGFVDTFSASAEL